MTSGSERIPVSFGRVRLRSALAALAGEMLGESTIVEGATLLTWMGQRCGNQTSRIPMEQPSSESNLPYSLIFRLCSNDFQKCRNKARSPRPPMASFILEARISWSRIAFQNQSMLNWPRRRFESTCRFCESAQAFGMCAESMTFQFKRRP